MTMTMDAAQKQAPTRAESYNNLSTLTSPSAEINITLHHHHHHHYHRSIMLFSWANKQLERLSETLAPPPTDANGVTSASHRFMAALVSGNDEGLALAILRDQDDTNTYTHNNGYDNAGGGGAACGGGSSGVFDPTAPLNVRGMSALHLAAKHGASYLLQELIQVRGVNVNIVDKDGNTALHHAAMANNTNINSTNTSRTTPLDTVKLLVETYGANVLSKNNAGETPYDVAMNSSQAVRGYLLPRQLQAETAIMEAENSYNNGMGGGGPPPPPPPPMMGSPPMHQQQQQYHGGGGGDAPYDPVAALMQPTVGAVTRLRHTNHHHHQRPPMQQQQQYHPLQSPQQQYQVASSSATPGAGMVQDQQLQQQQQQQTPTQQLFSSDDNDAIPDKSSDEFLSSSLQEISLSPRCDAKPSVVIEEKISNASATALFGDAAVGQYHQQPQQEEQQQPQQQTTATTATFHMTTLQPPPPPFVSVTKARATMKSENEGDAPTLPPPPMNATATITGTDATDVIAASTATDATASIQQPSYQTATSTTELPTHKFQEPPQQSFPPSFTIPSNQGPTSQSQAQPSAAPSSVNSTNSGYALRGGHANAAAAILSASSPNSDGVGGGAAIATRRIYKPDGFHSSSNDRELQAKYGHVTNEYEQRRYMSVGPPPKSGGLTNDSGTAGGMGLAASASPVLPQPPVSGGGIGGYNNPYSASGGGINTRVRYPTYSPAASSSSGGSSSAYFTTYSAPPSFGSGYNANNQASAVPTYATFQQPPQQHQQQQQQQFSPPPPAHHQQQHFQQ